MNDKVYYLSHPYTSIGCKSKNLVQSNIIAKSLVQSMDIVIINPLAIVPLVTQEEDRALEICKILLKKCDALILCKGWQLSHGCKCELKWALEFNIPIYIYKNGKLKKFKISKCILSRLKNRWKVGLN